MSTSSELIDAELAARGTADITASDAFRAWEYTERHAVAHVAVLRTVPMSPGMVRPALLRELAADEAPAQNRTDTTDLPWAGLAGDELQEYLVGEVSRQVSAELRLPTEELDIRRPLAEMGLDSVLTLVIRRRLEKHFRLSLPTTLLWNWPTVQAIGEFLTESLSAAAHGEPQATGSEVTH
jgi:6-methylsalicylic acid synthase